jgi:23S rRNA (uridine2552-2'-O)-methyltransferase
MVKKNQWPDHYSRLARRQGYPARSVYKLEEIQRKYKLMQKGDRILDLGCAPGAWLLYAAKLVGKSGQVVGIDLTFTPIRLPSQAQVLTGDLLAPDEKMVALWQIGFHVVLSDMAPATSGNRWVDAARSYKLCQAAWSAARICLLPKGAFVCKIFSGQEVELFLADIRPAFEQVTRFKPKSSRKASKEIYIIGRKKK